MTSVLAQTSPYFKRNQTIMTTQTDGRSLIFDLGGQHPVVVNLDEDEDNDSDGTLLGDEFEERFVRPTPEVVFIRSQPLATPPDDNTKRLDSYAHEGRTYKPGKTIELLSGAFLRITAIVHSPHDQSVCLKGLMFRRNSALDGLFERQRNEVTMNLDYDDADPRDIYHQSTKVTQLSEVVRIRDLIKTNQPFPVASFREMDTRRDIHGLGKDFILNHGRLVCRYKQVITSRTEGYLEVLAEDEADVDWGMDPRELRCHFRGETERGGMCRRWLDGEREFDHCERLNRGTSRRHGSLPTDTMDLDSPELVDMTGNEPNIRNRRYTIGDAFCGAGGASRGAKVAGLRVDWGFDFDRAAIDSYQRNFYTTRCEGIAAHEFVTVINENFQVDVLHLSPPCQTFSPIHVHRGQNDEINEATFLATAEIIKKVKPRIVTLEETFGLTRTVDNLQWFEALIQMFTKLGFSVRWKVFNLCDFGLPQPRKRLFILASW